MLSGNVNIYIYIYIYVLWWMMRNLDVLQKRSSFLIYEINAIDFIRKCEYIYIYICFVMNDKKSWCFTEQRSRFFLFYEIKVVLIRNHRPPITFFDLWNKSNWFDQKMSTHICFVVYHELNKWNLNDSFIIQHKLYVEWDFPIKQFPEKYRVWSISRDRLIRIEFETQISHDSSYYHSSWPSAPFPSNAFLCLYICFVTSHQSPSHQKPRWKNWGH